MKKILKNKSVVIAVCSLLVISLCVVIAMSVRDNEPEKEPNTQPTESTTENIETESTTESTTENTTESTTQKPETTTKKTETTTKKPVTTTKKPETTTKKPETTTKKSETTTNSDDAWLEKAVWSEVGCKTEEEYEAYLATVPNYKCPYCGDHNCPSITYETNRLGDTVIYLGGGEVCPAVEAGKVKCPNGCGRILVDNSDERWRTDPENYCRGGCHLGFS